MKLSAGVRLVIAWGVLCFLSTGMGVCQERVAITPVSIVDVTDGTVHSRQTILIEGDRIALVGAAGDVDVPDDATVVDAEDGYLIPGLWDMHAHVTRNQRVQSFSRLLLANGITGYRDPFGSLEVAADAREAVRAGKLPGPPRIIAAGNMVDGPPGIVPGAILASSPEEGRQIVDSLQAVGVPFVKVYFSLSPDTYFAIAERSRQLNLPFAGHVPFMVRAADASDAGQRSIEHLTGIVSSCSSEEEAILDKWRELSEMDMRDVVRHYMDIPRLALDTQDDEACRHLLDRFVRNETWQVPTLVSLRGKAYLREHAAADDSRTAYFPPPDRWTGERPFGFPMIEEQWDILQAQYEREKEIVAMMAAAGVPILAGSDTATPWAFPGFGLHEEMELLAESGLTPLQVLQTATLNPARFFDRTEDLGTIEEGKLADLVLLRANPLEDIRNTQEIRAVVAGGRLYQRDDLDGLLADVKTSVKQAGGQE